MTVFALDDLKDAFKAMDEAKESLDAFTVEWQKKLTVGDFFVRLHGGIPIFCEVLDPAVPADGAVFDSDELAEIEADALWYNEPHMQNFRFCKAYSQFCEHGELGDVHVGTAGFKILKEDFEGAKEQGWKVYYT